MTRHDLHKFLGLINFYHQFVPHCAQILKQLSDLLYSSSGKTFQWTKQTSNAFDVIKGTLTQATLLYHPKLNASTCIMAMHLIQLWVEFYNSLLLINGVLLPLQYSISTKLKPAETRYSVFDREFSHTFSH